MSVEKSKRLWVGNIAYSATKGDLRKIFEQVGVVVDVYTPFAPEKGSGMNKGYAFVEMSKVEEAETAINTLNGYIGPKGRELFVKWASPR